MIKAMRNEAIRMSGARYGSHAGATDEPLSIAFETMAEKLRWIPKPRDYSRFFNQIFFIGI